MQTVIIQHDYALAPAVLWAAVSDRAEFALNAVSRPLRTGQRLCADIAILGRPHPHLARITECDHGRMILRIALSGFLAWHHTLAVTPAADCCRLTERFEIAQGMLNPLFALLARNHCAMRHRRRLLLIATGSR
ncbi:MAG: hypothetical protein Q4G26_14365 [Paracoccus sp. (in: a-proteobacteria)]|nr:hypothetical protein [Paracoccus sp. (in: a-proteobacteria)]